MAEEVTKQLELLRRGSVDIYTEQELALKLKEAAQTGRQLRIKLGLDPTSPDIHLGHTVQLRKVRQFQDLGHKAVLLIGDYTARIGDPSGEDTTRPILATEQIEANARTYFKQAGKVLDTSEDKLEVRYNSKWLEKLNLMEVIRLVSNKTVAQMLQRDSFKKRFRAEEDIFMHEFIYPVMQGYDSVVVKSDIELGGTDQTFNNLIGRDIQKAYGQSPQVVIILPILVGLDGKEKMSKSKGNYIGITDEPNDMFGKIMSISDDMMENYFTLLTDIQAEEIATLTNPEKTHPKEAKVRLGKTVVSTYYNADAAADAAAHFEKVFAQRELPDDMPQVQLAGQPITAAKLLLHCNLVATGGEAKRMIKQAAVSINGSKINDPNSEIRPEDGMVVRVGRRKFAQLKVKK